MTKEYEKLISELVAEGYLKSPALIAAFRAVDRRDFVPRAVAKEAYGNYPLPIGYGQTISQPLTVAFMLEHLAPEPGEHILEIGAGSGWQTALLAHAVGPNGRVVAVERVLELAKDAEVNLAPYGFVKKGIVKIVTGDGSRGYASDAPYDKIIAAAAAAHDIPRIWHEELRPGGRIVTPVGQGIVVSDKISENEFREKEHLGFSFVPLVEG